jgi:hypothetical protein
MIYLCLFSVFSGFSWVELNFDYKKVRLELAVIFCLISAFLIAMAGTRTIGYDYENYENLYKIVDLSNFTENTIEVGYAALTQFCNFIGLTFHEFFFLIAFIAVGIKMIFLFRWSVNWFLSLTYYFVIGFTVNEMGQVRHGLAIGIVLLAFGDLFNKNYKGFFIKTFVAFLFHASAIIVFPVYFLVKRNSSPSKILCSLLLFLPFVFINLKSVLALIIDYLPLTQVQAKLSYYVLTEDIGQALGFNMSLILRLIFLALLYKYYKLGVSRYYYYDTLYKLYYFGIVLYMVFNAISDLAIRSSLYFKTLECLIMPIVVSLGVGRIEKNLIWCFMILYSLWSLYKIIYDPSSTDSYLPYKTYLLDFSN